MKRLIAALCLATVLVSCGNEATDTNDTDGTTDNTTTTDVVADAKEMTDPTCGMVNDGTWTEYSVSGTDTTWFCSETCKTTYAAKMDSHDDHDGHNH